MRQLAQIGPTFDALGRSYDSLELDALFIEDESSSNGIENFGMTTTTPHMENLQNMEDESTITRIVELLKNG